MTSTTSTPIDQHMTTRRRLVAASVLAASVAVIAGALAFGGDDASTAEPDERLVVGPRQPGQIVLEPRDVIGVPAPTTSFVMFDGTVATLADFEGQPLVLNFFASWCAPCVAEMPEFEELHQRLGDRVQFLGVNLQDPPAEGQRIVDRTGVTYALARDMSGELFSAIGAFAMPTTVLIDADGTIVDLRGGKIGQGELAERIERHLL